MVRIDATADDSFAAIFERSKFGMAMAAKMRMIDTTTNNSIRENPRCLFIASPGETTSHSFRRQRTSTPHATYNRSTQDAKRGAHQVHVPGRLPPSALLVENENLFGRKKREEAKLPPQFRKLGKELVADRARSRRGVGNASATSRRDADRGSSSVAGVGDELHHAYLIITERADARGVHHAWRGIHFEAVVNRTHQKRSPGIEKVAALGERSGTQQRVNQASRGRSGLRAGRGSPQVRQGQCVTGTPTG